MLLFLLIITDKLKVTAGSPFWVSVNILEKIPFLAVLGVQCSGAVHSQGIHICSDNT